MVKTNKRNRPGLGVHLIIRQPVREMEDLPGCVYRYGQARTGNPKYPPFG